MIPKIKKSIKKFMLDEGGAVSKQNLLKIGALTVFATVSVSQNVTADASCSGSTCDKLYDECSESSGCEITDDMRVIFDDEDLYGKTANLYDDQPGWHMNETQGSAHSSEWWCADSCKTKWGYEDAHSNGTYNWGCIDRVTNENSEHWNAGHHRNSISLESAELAIDAKHSNELFFVDKTMYPLDYCGEQHTSNS